MIKLYKNYIKLYNIKYKKRSLKMEEHIDLFKKILTQIEDKVDYADIRAGKGNNTSIIMKDNQIQEINTGLSTVARIRVLQPMTSPN